MDKLNIPTPSNGVPFNWEDAEFSWGIGVYNDGIIQSIEAMLVELGTDFIVQGVEISGSNVTEGWVMLDSVLTKVDAHTPSDDYFVLVQTNNSDGAKQTQLGGIVDVYQENRAVASASSGTLENPITGSPDRLSDRIKIISKKTSVSYTATIDGDVSIDNTIQYVNYALDLPFSKTLTIPNPADTTSEYLYIITTNTLDTLYVQQADLTAIFSTSTPKITLLTNNGTSWEVKYSVLSDLASVTEARQLSNNNALMSPYSVGLLTGGLKCTVLDIGDWNMDTDGTKSVTHGLTLANIRSVTVTIRDDAGTTYSPIPDFFASVVNAGINRVDATDVYLTRLTSGQYDDANYNSTSYNRGWITIWHT